MSVDEMEDSKKLPVPFTVNWPHYWPERPKRDAHLPLLSLSHKHTHSFSLSIYLSLSLSLSFSLIVKDKISLLLSSGVFPNPILDHKNPIRQVKRNLNFVQCIWVYKHGLSHSHRCIISIYSFIILFFSFIFKFYDYHLLCNAFATFPGSKRQHFIDNYKCAPLNNFFNFIWTC